MCESFERDVNILEAFRLAVEVEGRAAVIVGDEMIDEGSRKLALVTADQGEREGIVYRSVPEGVPIDERRAWRPENPADEASVSEDGAPETKSVPPSIPGSIVAGPQ